MMEKLTRRKFVKNTIIASAALPISAQLKSQKAPQISAERVPLQWLDGMSKNLMGTTWGTPWPKGSVKKKTEFSLVSGETDIAVQTWPLAYWPDGSLKWTAHAIAPQKNLSKPIQLKTGKTALSSTPLTLTEGKKTIQINTGKIQCVINKSGHTLIRSLSGAGTTTVAEGKLVLWVQDKAGDEPGEAIHNEWFEGKIEKVTIEQSGPVRATIKIEGRHANTGHKGLLPFVVRLYFYAGSEAIKVMHTFIYDADENKDFIRGLGIRFDVDLKEAALHDRHVRFVGDADGIFAEAVRGLTGLRRDPGRAFTQNQVEGKPTPDTSLLPEAVSRRLQYIPAFGDYTLCQATPDAFEIRKRTKTGHSWLQSAFGKRAGGTVYLGTPNGGIAAGIRNFWQSHPAQIDVRDAHLDQAQLTLWLWAPDAKPMDLRFYHDGLGQNTFAQQLEGLQITYEDYEPEFGRPYGVARTSELCLYLLPATPSHHQLAEISRQIQQPPVLAATPAYLQQTGVFGGAISLPDTTSVKKAEIEKQLDFYFDYYKNQVEQHHWYGFWNYGDFMHSYDTDRHVWKYDVGGFAWDNSELSTDLWLWYYFLRSGKQEAFRLAEAMTRHTGEVDVHHIGPFSPLGSRHNVMHWGCSAKQLRISTATNRRYYYYLTGDERVGDLMREQIDAVKTLQTIVPIRKVNQNVPKNTENSDFASVSFGTDWGAIAGAWLTEWERTEDRKIRDKLINSMRTIASQPHGFFTGLSFLNLKTGEFRLDTTGEIAVSHLNAVFGLPEICFELVELVKDPAFEKAWLQYCELYNAEPAEQQAVLGKRLSKLNLQQGHARLTAYAAKQSQNPKLAARAWKEFYAGEGGIRKISTETSEIKRPTVLNTTIESPGISTNAVAQWSLAAMHCLAFAGNSLD
jgi:hypothetical protein